MKPGVRWLDLRQLSYLLNPELADDYGVSSSLIRRRRL